MMFCYGEDNEPGNDGVIITLLTGLRGGTMTALSRRHTTWVDRRQKEDGAYYVEAGSWPDESE
jgi:hypothetical protein